MVGYANTTSGFTAFMANTGPKWLSDKEHFVNMMQSVRNYASLFWFLKGKPMSEVLAGGSTIQEALLTDFTPNSKFYQLGDDQGATISQKQKTLVEYWRFAMHGGAWQEETMVLNAGASMNSKARAASWKNEWKRYHMDLHTGIVEFWDAAIWAKPDYDLMEGVDGKVIKSVPVFLNEGANGLFNQGSANGGSWTSIHGLLPGSTSPKYKPAQLTYGTTASDGFASGSPGNVIFGLDNAIEATRWQAPPIYTEDFNSDTDMFKGGGHIATSLMGKNLMRQTNRNSQDRWDNQNDPYGNPMYGGTPIVYVGQLDSAPLYINAAGTTTVKELDSTAAKIGPRYYGIMPDSIKLIWHEDRYMEPIQPMNSREQPTRYTEYYNSFAAMVCTNRRKSFILSPFVSQTGIAYPTQGSTATFPAQVPI